MGEHFSRVGPVNVSGVAGWQGLDIHFERAPNPPAPDSKVEDLRRAYEGVVQKLHFVARKEDEFMRVFNEIISSAESSLVAAGGTVDDGNERLGYIKMKILDLGRRRRSRYFLRILLFGAATSVLGLVLWAAVSLAPHYLPLQEWGYLPSYKSALSWLVPACLMLPGVALGIVFVGFATNRLSTYEGVGQMDRYDFLPWIRFTWVLLVAYVLFAALWFEVFVLGVGNIVLNKVTTESRYGFLIGLVCGVSEALVAELLVSWLRPVARQQGT